MFDFTLDARLLDDESMTDEAKKLAIKYFQTGNLIKICQNAIDLVAENSELIRDPKLRDKFMKQSAKKAAKSLCTTIVRYMYLKLNGCNVPEFEYYWIDLANRDIYLLKRKLRPSRKVFTYYKSVVCVVCIIHLTLL